MPTEDNYPSAFISCSLREEDRRFVEFIEHEVYHQISIQQVRLGDGMHRLLIQLF